MAEVRGNMIKLAGQLMSLYPEAQRKADDILFKRYGKHWEELSMEEFYDASVYDAFMKTYM